MLAKVLVLAITLSISVAWMLPACNRQRSGCELSMIARKDLPGQLAPTGYFDPLGLSEGKSDAVIKKWRESELKHGRICMLAAIGFLVQESFHPLWGFKNMIMGPAVYHFQEIQNIAPNFWYFLLFGIALVEGRSIAIGWEKLSPTSTDIAMLAEDYIPGDLGFDPFNLCPSTEEGFVDMRNKELQNGRLAMLAAAGMVAQELVDKRTILDHFVHFGLGAAKYGDLPV
mmetsp:Transcript_33408/g.34043  ORF Transcript_33408/g.34043 Transcript_33408/m.34043 type:complete len:228 (+) Transcript_33408:286-969(+)|eukprot:CAMPEP_0182427770 /NCGR_PEP_ID=MMETSP1167-20130531/19371_1 /TAXON_ID=2988 /ORGANISM="Mallomonas Sp, Strain CCMP3275" /LENGTH=227 /DNA_ID=CAMNT_0024610235 /DNA_START=175 /DNA_END=858 /DNA_ORIENTATION=+